MTIGQLRVVLVVVVMAVRIYAWEVPSKYGKHDYTDKYRIVGILM
jgi:hypothetical protein